MASRAKTLLTSPRRLEKSNVHWRRPAIIGAVTGLIATVCIATGHNAYALPLVTGAWFTALLDTHDLIGPHLRKMCGTVLWLSVGATIGGLASSTGYWQLIIVAVVAFICGFAGAFGNFGLGAGSLALAMYALFAGMPVSERTALQGGALTLLGGAISISITLVIYLVGARSQVRVGGAAPAPRLATLKSHLRPDDPYLRHAVRLSVLMVIATAIAHSMSWPHEYWIPMTVAWVARPGRILTLERTWNRILGTLAGIVFITCLMLVTGNPPYELAFLITAGVTLHLALVRANYAIAVSGLTVTIMALFAIDGQTVEMNAPYRIVATLIAGLLLSIGALLWPVAEEPGAK
jgi:uncharacterized membrane protein YccC